MRFPKLVFVPLAAALGLPLIGCESNNSNNNPPPAVSENNNLDNHAQAAMDSMNAKDTGISDITQGAYGYAIFPSVGEAAVGVGGAGGKGVVYQQGQRIGYATLNQGSVGLQLGGETYAELIIFKTPEAIDVFKNGNLTFGADASATLVKAGAASQGQFNNGTRVFVQPHGGLMAGVAITGQKFNYHPIGG